jgi:surface protein
MILIYLVASYKTQWAMFGGASAFNQDLSNWNISSGTIFVS